MKNTAWNKLGAYLKETQILGSIQSTLYWDQNTAMPKEGSSWRGEQLMHLAKVLHARNSSDEFFNLINLAKSELNESSDFLNDENSAKKKNIELLNKEFDRQRKLDPKLVTKLARAKSQGYESWQQAKKNSDFRIFLPHFKELIKLRREEANQLSDKLSPWETLAQPYEPDISKEWLFNIFNPLKESLPHMLEKIKKVDKKKWDIDPSSQKRLCDKLLDKFGCN